jgi:hypothetical protein
MLQILGVAVETDCDNIRTDCSEVVCKQKTGPSKEDQKAQNEFHHSVGGALVNFATNKSMSAYNTRSKEMRAAEVEIEELEDHIEEAELDCDDKKVACLKKRLHHWQSWNDILENMLRDATKKEATKAKPTTEQEEQQQEEVVIEESDQEGGSNSDTSN